MRYGFTTGSCAAAAAKAAAYMLLTGNVKQQITIQTPKGIPYTAEIEQMKRSECQVSCAVRKDGGDDPDITTGTLVYATVTYAKQWSIDGGIGVGLVTKPGLDQPVGNAAINRVPREMIQKEVQEICRLADYEGNLKITISVPDGERLAASTFNPRLGIVGGISIIGTSGIVEPMSSQALLETIRVELRQKRVQGALIAAVSPGNYGLDFMKNTYDYDLERSVKCSNFIGDTIDMAAELGFEKLLLTGHIGKLIKVSGGMLNTHSREGDCRMELLAAFAVLEGVGIAAVREILACVTTEEAVRILNTEQKSEAVLNHAMDKIMFYLNKRAAGKLEIECIVYANEYGTLAKSAQAEIFLRELQEE